MAKYDEHLTAEELSEYSYRYIVRVGVDRAPPIEFISPVVLSKCVDFVVLLAGWTHDLQTISGDPKVINVGDIVEVRAQKGRYFDFLVSLVRQYSDPVAPGENKDWNIGCKTYKEFDNRGFAGDYHSSVLLPCHLAMRCSGQHLSAKIGKQVGHVLPC